MPDVDRLPSGRWQARTRVGGRQLKASFDRKADAQAWLAEVSTDRARGQYVDERAGRTPVAEYARAYVAARPYRASSGKRMRGYLGHVAGTPIGAMRLGEVRGSHVQAWATDRARLLAPTTMGNLVGFVRSVFAAAADDRLIGRSPVPRRVALPRRDAVVQVVPVTVAEVRAIAAQMPPRARAMVLVQAGLGVRVQELLALRVGDVDFLRRAVRVEDQLDPASRERLPLKTPESRRTVPLPGMVAEALAEHIASFGHGGPAGELFTMADGRTPWRYNRVRSMYAEAVAAAGVVEQDGTHFLRHHFASVLLEAGESVVTVAARLGHATPALVLSTYGHLMPNGEDRTRRAIDAAWTASAPDVPAEGAAGR